MNITQDKTNSRLLKAVERIAITPQEANKIVSQLYAKALKRSSQKSEYDLRLVVAKKIVNRYAKLAATSGGATALTGIVPGIGTALTLIGGGMSDAVICMKLQVDMTTCLAENFKRDISSTDARRLAFLIAGGATLEKFGVKSAGARMANAYLKGAVTSTVKAMFKKIGITFTRKALEKSIPFGIGVAVSSTTNYALTKYVGNRAIRSLANAANATVVGMDKAIRHPA